jgi:hypothetical protein
MQFVNTPSMERTVSVSANQLATDVLITTLPPFEVSLTSGAGFAQSLSITPVNGTVPASTIYVRMNSTAVGPFTGTINVASGAATPRTVQLSGEATTNIGINELAAAPPLNAWPIPAFGDVLHLDRMVSGEVVALDGRTVLSADRITQLDIGTLAPGTYTLRCTDGARLRFVKGN